MIQQNKLTFRRRVQNATDNFRHQLAYIDALPQLSLLGLVIGITTALVVIGFRLAIEWPLSQTLPLHSDNFEALPAIWRLLLPLGGAALIGLALLFIPAAGRRTSVSHVLERLHNHQGNLPLQNFWVQFIGGVTALWSGQSVGREGPAVLLGATAASQIGQWLRLPNNSMQTLIACGVAAAIAASFNTPVAGVIFAMEVILMEYTITGFLPVMVAAVTGTAFSHWFFGPASSFNLHTLPANRLLEIPFWLFSGLLIGVIATVYSRLQLNFVKFQSVNVFVRISLAGLVTGLIALAVPQVMGLGYDTIDAAMHGTIPLTLLLGIIAAKLLVTSVSVGLGIPGGLIGPVLVIGACVGGVLGLVAQTLAPEASSQISLYVVIGMSAMMGAVLNAPLAALMAVMELTYNPAAMFPSLLVIVVSCLVARYLMNHEGIFMGQLQATGSPITNNPARKTLNRIGVRSAMTTAFRVHDTLVSESQARNLLQSHPQWIVVMGNPQHTEAEQEPSLALTLLRASSLANYLERDERTEETEDAIDLLAIPAQRYELGTINPRANLYEAYEKMKEQNLQALYVEADPSQLYSETSPSQRILGVITQENIDNFYALP